MTALLGRFTSSPFNYWGTIVVDLIGAGVFAWLGWTRYRGPIAVGILLVLGGFLSWTLAEYLLHRFLLHGFPIARREHAKHHQDTHALISTPLMMIPVAASLVCAALAWPTSFGVAALATSGLYVGYNYFVIVHHLQHFHPELLARSKFFERNLRLHELHHDRPDAHFGISCSIWDRAFGSFL